MLQLYKVKTDQHGAGQIRLFMGLVPSCGTGVAGSVVGLGEPVTPR